MASHKDDETISHPELPPEQVSGTKIGLVIVVVMSIFLILGMTLSIFCPDIYERLRAIGYVIMSGQDSGHTSDDDD